MQKAAAAHRAAYTTDIRFWLNSPHLVSVQLPPFAQSCSIFILSPVVLPLTGQLAHRTTPPIKSPLVYLLCIIIIIISPTNKKRKPLYIYPQRLTEYSFLPFVLPVSSFQSLITCLFRFYFYISVNEFMCQFCVYSSLI